MAFMVFLFVKINKFSCCCSFKNSFELLINLQFIYSCSVCKLYKILENVVKCVLLSYRQSNKIQLDRKTDVINTLAD